MPRLTLFRLTLTSDELDYLEDLLITYAVDMRFKNSILDSIDRAELALNLISPDQEE